jgi:hypothetical protein
LPSINLLGGEYYFKVGVFDQFGMVRWDFLENAIKFKVSGGYVAEGVIAPQHSWSVEQSSKGTVTFQDGPAETSLVA